MSVTAIGVQFNQKKRVYMDFNVECKQEILGEWIEPTPFDLLLKKDKDFLINEIMFQNDRATERDDEIKKQEIILL